MVNDDDRGEEADGDGDGGDEVRNGDWEGGAGWGATGNDCVGPPRWRGASVGDKVRGMNTYRGP